VATGHYARTDVVAIQGRPVHRLLRGVDRAKDQAYFLYGLRQGQVARALFPLGALVKEEVRTIARARGLVTADKAESMEICFVPEGDVHAALRARAGWSPGRGPTVDGTDGRIIGEHGGAAAFTIGQRRGVGAAVGEPRYVSRIDLRSNTIVLARRSDLDTRAFAIDEATFVEGPPPGATSFRALAQVRHRAAPVAATVRRVGGSGDAWAVETDTPVWAAAPGQACVLFDPAEPDVVLGGGRIARRAPVA
jgi:tRNA-specific 2-thiouridylase